MTAPQPEPSITLPVYCDRCDVKIGEIKDGRMVVFGRHHGAKHKTVLNPPVSGNVIAGTE